MSYKLEEIAEFQKGFAFKSKDFKDSGVRIVKVSNLTSESIDSSSCVCIDDDLAEKYIQYELIKDDIIITTVGSWPTNPASVVGKVVKVPENMNNSLLNQNAVRIRGNSSVNQRYLYYLLKSNNFRDYIIGTAQGSANQASITQKDIKNFKYDIPTLKEQEAISKILSDIDDKIEINNKINKKLEEMAQAIFKQWFVDFEFPNEDGKPYKSSGGEMVESELGMIPKGWSYTNIESVVSAANTGADAIRRAPIVDYNTGIKCVRVGDMSNKRDISSWAYCEVNDEDYKKFSLKKNDILVTRTATIGLNTFIFEDLKAVYNNGLIRLKVKEDFNPIYIYQVMNHKDFMEHISKITGETSTRPNMKINYLLNYKFILPEKDIRDKFEKIIIPILDKINSNNHENEKLAISRDTLLPKLMSGEIRVPID